jgi:multiple sugar transport system substrate-binding protein
MKKEIKVLAALTALVTFSLTVAGCGGNSTTGSSSTPLTTTESARPSTPAAEQPSQKATVEITVWDKPHADEVTRPFIESQFAAFEAKYPNIKVTHVEPTKEKEREQFMTAVAGGKQPDTYRSAYPDMESYINQGIAADITELWEANPDKGNYLPSSLNAATVNKKIYGVPNEMYVTGLLYNKKLFSEAKIDPATALKDWNSFGDAAQKLTDPAKGQYGYAILGMDWADWHFEYYVWQAGGDLTEKQADGTAKLTFTSDATVKALQYYKDLKFKYKATQKNVVQSYDDNNKDFYTGHAATMVGASDSFRSLLPKGMDINDIGFSALPVGPSGISPAQVGGNYWIINPKASKEKQQAAFTYASFFTSKEYGETYLQYLRDNGIFPNLLTVRTDVDVAKYVKGLPTDIVTNVQAAAKSTHLEYFLKSRLSPYIVKPIQKVLLDEKADPMTELKAAQELAQKEVIDKYNADNKK